MLDVSLMKHTCTMLLASALLGCKSSPDEAQTVFLETSPPLVAPINQPIERTENSLHQVDQRIAELSASLEGLTEAARELGLPTFFCGNDLEAMMEVERRYQDRYRILEETGVASDDLNELVLAHIQIQSALKDLELMGFVQRRGLKHMEELSDLLKERQRMLAKLGG